MTTREEVQTFLNKMTNDRVKDETVELMLSMAIISVNQEKSSAASNDIIDAAILTDAAYLSYLAYATEFERTVGDVPLPMLTHLGELKLLATKYLGYAIRGVTARVPVIVSTESIDTISSFT